MLFDQICAVGSSLDKGLHLLDFYPDSSSPCHVECSEDMVNTSRRNRFVPLSEDVSACAAHPPNGFIVAGTKLQGTENSKYLDLLRLFAHGTWSDYKSSAGSLPPLANEQILKLEQLTVLTLAETSKVLPYDHLMQELDVTNVRELEDFLINECMYAGIVRGKLDQLRRCFEVQFAAGRDLRPGQLGSMIHTLTSWLETSDNLLLTIQEKIKWADTMSELDKKHKKEVEDRGEEVKKTLSFKKLHTSRPTWTSEGMRRSTLNLAE